MIPHIEFRQRRTREVQHLPQNDTSHEEQLQKLQKVEALQLMHWEVLQKRKEYSTQNFPTSNLLN